jgi:integrase
VSREIGRVKAAITDMGVGDKAVTDMGAGDLRVLLSATADQPGAARHRFGAINRYFDWCKDEGIIACNPCDLIGKDRKPKPMEARSASLSVEQIGSIWKAAGEAEKLEPVHRDLIRFLMVVPCRRGEAASMRWEHVDLREGVWVQPGRLTKNKTEHRVPLHALALDILGPRHKAAGEPKEGLVFPSPQVGAVVSTFSMMKAAVAAKVPDLRDWRLHDVRRSFVSILSAEGHSEAVLDGMLNHKQSASRPGVMAVYQHAPLWQQRTLAMRRWGEMLAEAIEGKP